MLQSRLRDKVTKYKYVGERSYNTIGVDDIIQLQLPLIFSLSVIEAGEMFRFIERLNASLWRVKRISTGKTYKVYAAKFIPRSSMIYIPVYQAREDHCIWNKAK